MYYRLLLLFLFLPGAAWSQKVKADLLVYNAVIYTVDKNFAVVSAMSVNAGKIVEVGNSRTLQKKYEARRRIDAKGSAVYPGFIDAHAHFVGYASGLQIADLTGTKSWQEILDRLQPFGRENPEGWLTGRGWDQNDWDVKEFPDKKELDRLFPDRPVLLARIDGHAAIANQKAMDMAAIRPGQEIAGGLIEVKEGTLTGLLIDNAVELVASKIPAASLEQVKRNLLRAQKNCFAVGLTTIDDCGLDYKTVQLIDSLQQKQELKMRIYAMLSDAAENYAFLFRSGIIKNDFLHVRAFKVYADGALGSRGACLLEPYSDQKNWRGFLRSTAFHFDSVAALLYKTGFQMCTHAIGDSGNRLILKTYAKYLEKNNDRRWRIEHAQVVQENDFGFFGRYRIIPSVQPTHATSDMYWAGDRLGMHRLKGAYAYKQLLDENGWLPLGTDFPVEDISPFKTFFAAVFRKDANGFPKNGFQMENALTREQALRGMTIWAARSNFEEHEKGSLEKGKFADFVILDKDIMTLPAREILHTSVVATYVGGEKVYSKN
jgi:predicted amidohydrolase YtcJ